MMIVIMMIVIMMIVIMLIVIMMRVIMLSVIMLCVNIANVVAPISWGLAFLFWEPTLVWKMKRATDRKRQRYKLLCQIILQKEKKRKKFEEN